MAGHSFKDRQTHMSRSALLVNLPRTLLRRTSATISQGAGDTFKDASRRPPPLPRPPAPQEREELRRDASNDESRRLLLYYYPIHLRCNSANNRNQTRPLKRLVYIWLLSRPPALRLPVREQNHNQISTTGTSSSAFCRPLPRELSLLANLLPHFATVMGAFWPGSICSKPRNSCKLTAVRSGGVNQPGRAVTASHRAKSRWGVVKSRGETETESGS